MIDGWDELAASRESKAVYISIYHVRVCGSVCSVFDGAFPLTGFRCAFAGSASLLARCERSSLLEMKC